MGAPPPELCGAHRPATGGRCRGRHRVRRRTARNPLGAAPARPVGHAGRTPATAGDLAGGGPSRARLSAVQVRRARAEELTQEVSVPFVTARAVAPLDRLVRWGAPLLVPGGEMLAIKGRSAQDELAEHATLLRRWGISGEVVRVGGPLLEERTVVVRLVVPDPAAVQPQPGRGPAGRGRARAVGGSRRALIDDGQRASPDAAAADRTPMNDERPTGGHWSPR